MAVILGSFFSLLFLAMAMATLLSNQATAKGDLCEATTYKALCRAAVQGITDPIKATESAIKYAISRTKHYKALTMKLGKSAAYSDCTELYGNAIESLQESLESLKARDVGTLKAKLSGAISFYSTCDDGFVEKGQKSPLGKINQSLSHMVDNCLALVPSKL